MCAKLKKSFFIQEDVVKIAKELLGKTIYTCINGFNTTAVITETEAYAGTTDKASHAYGGRRTQRTETMYREGGCAYVYFCYGMHHLFNIVTNKKEIPHAVLIRAIYPLKGTDIMLNRVHKTHFIKNMGNGPGKVTKLLGINKTHDAITLTGKTIWLEDMSLSIDESFIIADKRIGIDYAGEDALLAYRFYLAPSCPLFQNNYI